MSPTKGVLTPSGGSVVSSASDCATRMTPRRVIITAVNLVTLKRSIPTALPKASVKNPDVELRMVELATLVNCNDPFVHTFAMNHSIQNSSARRLVFRGQRAQKLSQTSRNVSALWSLTGRSASTFRSSSRLSIGDCVALVSLPMLADYSIVRTPRGCRYRCLPVYEGTSAAGSRLAGIE